jgi:ribonuclease Y
VDRLKISGLHPESIKLLGKLRFRFSYNQNVLDHSIEVAQLCAMLAAASSAWSRNIAKRAGLLHDIGKAITARDGGQPRLIGARLHPPLRRDRHRGQRRRRAPRRREAARRSLLAHLTAAADAISGARPGARREMLESYVRRLEELEKICAGFKGVERSFAIQAGREVRVLVEPGEVDDLGAMNLSREIARKIESELAYPGQIRVTVVRETRAVDYAR